MRFSLFCLMGGSLVLGTAAHAADAPATPRVKLARDTTYFLAPLDATGEVDYEAALNQYLRGKITPRQNACVPLFQAIGPAQQAAAMPVGFYRWLEIPALPKAGDYFVDLMPYIRERAKLPITHTDNYYAQQFAAMNAPWKESDYPHIAKWLEVNEKPLALIVDASRRPEYYLPLISSGRKPSQNTYWSDDLFPLLRPVQDVARALAARAMLRTGRGELDQAWEDILTMHRLGRLIARGGTDFEFLFGLEIERAIEKTEIAYINHPKLTTKQIFAKLQDLQKLPPRSTTADKVDVTHRVECLENIQRFRRGTIGKTGEKPLTDAQRKEDDAWGWEAGQRKANRWHDRIVVAMRLRDRPARQKELEAMSLELQKVYAKRPASDHLIYALTRKWPPPMQPLGDMQVATLMFSYIHAQQKEDCAVQSKHNLQVAFALAAFRRDHARYPATLNDLSPNYLKDVPADLFTGKPLIYRPEPNGYLLYSVGLNGKDDGGRVASYDTRDDDIAIVVPAVRPKQD